jgi:drug/metabolite transporter (DMT)-like permease
MLSYVWAIIVGFLAQFCIYAGITFLTGQFIPSILYRVYEVIPTGTWRLVIAMMMFFTIGNYLFKCLYTMQPTLIAGIISIVTGVIAMMITGSLVEQKMPNLVILSGITLVIIGGIISIYGRNTM